MADGASVSWWQRLASLAKILFWGVLVVMVPVSENGAGSSQPAVSGG